MDLSILVKLALIYGGRKQKKIYPKSIARLRWESGVLPLSGWGRGGL